MARVDQSRVKAQLGRLSREPFLELLAELMETRPSAKALKALAERAPDKWVKTTGDLARLGGYADRSEHTENVYVAIGHMSDMELVQKLRDTRKEIDDLIELNPKADEAQPLELEASSVAEES